MKKQLLVTGLGALILAGCATNGRNPNVGVGVSIGGGAPPPVIAEDRRGGPRLGRPLMGDERKKLDIAITTIRRVACT